jgi:hypothetical protein
LVLLVSILSVWAPNFAPASGGPSALGSPLQFGIELESTALSVLVPPGVLMSSGALSSLVSALDGAFGLAMCWSAAFPLPLWGGEGLDFAFLAMVTWNA